MSNEGSVGESDNLITQHFHSPNIWTVLEKWTSALPAGDENEKIRKAVLQEQLKRFFDEFYSQDQKDDSVRLYRPLVTKAYG